MKGGDKLEHETWKPIENFPNYAVSHLGRVKRINSGTCSIVGKIKKPRDNGKGYLRVGLQHNGRRFDKSIHRLVLNAFVGGCPPKHQCNHKDGVKSNNNVGNLEWVTSAENHRHAFATGLKKACFGENHGRAKLKNNEVWLIKKLLASKKVLQKDIARMFKTDKTHISVIKHEKYWSHIRYP